MGGAPHNKGTRRLPPSLLFISPKEQHSRRPPTQLDADGKHQFAAIWDHELQAPWWPQKGRMCALKAPRSEHRTSLGGWVSFICSFLWPGQEVFRRCVPIVTVHGPGSVRVCRPPKVAAALTCLISDPALHLPGIRGPLTATVHNIRAQRPLPGSRPISWGLSMCSSTLSNQRGLTVLQVECDKHQTWKRLKDQASRGIHSVV